jgi:GntR family transcriptional regulator, transcriptional repressor for pyruvate dehydrogenase complex
MNKPSSLERGRYRYNEVAEGLKERIRRGELKVGERIPAERVLARSLGVSRNCVRQAIQALAEKKVLESRRGAGTYVRGVNESELIETFTLPLRGEKELYREILEFRLLMEPQIASLAAGNISREELDSLKVIVCDQERRIMAGKEDGELDSRFHLKLATATHNRVIIRMMDTVNGILNESRTENLWSTRRRESSVVGHLRIIDALENRDSQMAFRAMKEHLRSVGDIIMGAAEDAVPLDERTT